MKITDMPCLFCGKPINCVVTGSFGTHENLELIEGIVTNPFHLKCWDKEKFNGENQNG